MKNSTPKPKKKKAKIEISSGGVVFKKEDNKLKFLLILDGYGRWALPKGHIEKGESTKTAALREVSEETGLKKLKIVENLGQIKYFFRQGKDFIFKIVQFYLIEASPEEKPKPQLAEIKKVQWLAPNKALKKVAYKDLKPILKKAFSLLKTRPKIPDLR